MDGIAVVVGLILGIGAWAGIAHSMKRNGRPWWWRHLSGAVLAWLAMTGGSMLIASLGGVTDQEGEPLGAIGAFAGLVVLLPVILALGISWRAAKRQAPLVSKPEQKQAPTPEPQKPSRAAPHEVADTPEGRLRFVYEDAKGNMSNREVTDFHVSARYIKGYCLTRGEQRTFRRDRILSFLEGEELLEAASTPTTSIGSAPERPLEILFVGFDEESRQELEEEAELEGMKVRKSLTKNLDFLCAGPNAGPRKLSEARERGVTIMDEADFLEFLDTGALPS
ncbi:hypothetical protein GLV89_01720 [Halomonas alkaliantarctica]|nr:hypothetical protein [Halomonas alkaliantarctica]